MAVLEPKRKLAWMLAHPGDFPVDAKRLRAGMKTAPSFIVGGV